MSITINKKFSSAKPQETTDDSLKTLGIVLKVVSEINQAEQFQKNLSYSSTNYTSKYQNHKKKIKIGEMFTLKLEKIYQRPIYFRLDFKWHKIRPYGNHSHPLSVKETEIISQEIPK